MSICNRLADAVLTGTQDDILGLRNPESERDRGALIECLDDGFVRLVDWMGGDDPIVQATRVSYGKGTKKKSDDRNLIRYLMRNYHTTPFEMVEFKFHVRVPMDCWRQWLRHRTASVNEYCIRYSEAHLPRRSIRRRGAHTTRSPRC
jgi:thymidylate synthase (FAD)